MSGSRDERKVSSLRELPAAIDPPRDLWPQIAAQLDAERRGARTPGSAPRPARSWAVPPRWLAAAAMVASVAVGMWIGRSVLPTAALTAGNVARGPAAAPLPGAATALDAAYVSDPRYQRDRAALLQSLQAQIAALPPPARAKVLGSLAAIHQAKEDLEGALGKDPSNALLQELLVNTYQDEMRALTDLHQASDPGRGI